MSDVRTRFAPSPTGFLHVGGIRTALFAWLVARQHNGQFILRIEDTDQAREVEGSSQHIQESLQWLDLGWDEGIGKGGDFGPYRQGERLDTYKEWVIRLVENGHAYADPYSKEELEELRQKSLAAKKPFLYRDYRPENPPKWDGSQPLRLRSDPKPYSWHDEIMGNLSAGPEAVDDFVLIKSDGFPTYNFAHIIDDHLMKISHVIRSQEFIASVPRFLNLYEALGIERPLLATVPYVMGQDGKKKLSKRDGAKDILDYRREGYLPEALVNFIATLGWNDGSEQEVFSVSELIEKFSLDRVHRGGARFDEKRLEWMNGTWVRSLPLDDLYQRAGSYWPAEAAHADEQYKQKVLGLVQERLKYLAELPNLTNFFFADLPVDIGLIDDDNQLKKFSHEELRNLLEQAKAALETCDFSVQSLTDYLNKLLEATQQKPAVLFSLIRVATTQASFSPPLAETMFVLGKETSLRRLNQTLSSL